MRVGFLVGVEVLLLRESEGLLYKGAQEEVSEIVANGNGEVRRV